jgi:hypothetical protein
MQKNRRIVNTFADRKHDDLRMDFADSAKAEELCFRVKMICDARYSGA